MKQVFKSSGARLAALGLVIAAVSAACSIRSPIWVESKQPGPPLASGGATWQVQKCEIAKLELFPGGPGHCVYAFASKSAELLMLDELRREVEQSLGLAHQLRPLLLAYQAQYQPDPKRWIRYPDYVLYAVAVHPTIVVGVPSSTTLHAGCGAPGGVECFTISDPKGRTPHSQRGWTFGLYYAKRPPVVAGSFVYVPTFSAGSVELPIDQAEVSVRAGEREFKLVNFNGLWQLDP